MNAELFGLELNVWADAAIRLQLIVLFMTVVVMGYTYLERKIIARFNQRIGPQRTGPFGLLQAVADALKLVGKEDLRPKNADAWTFELGPYFIFIPIFMGFVITPFMAGWEIRLLDLGLLYFVAVSSLSIVGWMMAGWGSDNRYAMIGAMRAAAQGISYELPLVLSLLAVGMYAGSFNLGEIIAGQQSVPLIVWQPMAAMIFFIAALAELNRTPFDIPVGESEVVGGPFVEYSGIRWSMFQLGEYAGLFIISLVFSAVFLGGYLWPFGDDLGVGFQALLTLIKAGLFFFVVVWIRVSVPRLRIDQLMSYSWKVLLPLALVQVLVNGLVLVNGWSELILLATGLVGVVFLAMITNRAVSTPRTRPGALRAPALAGGGSLMKGIARSMMTTLSTLTRKPVTRNYPDVHKPLPKTDRAFPLLLWDKDVDEPFCTGCHACERACPVECMTVLMKDNPNHKSLGGDSSRRKIIDKFWIDYARCMRCNICVEVCNFDAIAMNNTWTGHETSVHDRKDLVMDLQQLLAQSRAGRIEEWVPVIGQTNN